MGVGNEELKILARFIDGALVGNEQEEKVLEEYRKIGWVKMGMKAEKSGDMVKVTPTAALTPLGRQFVKRERILNSRWKKYFYKLVNLPA